ncbi:MAG TPA: hypothetical protein VK066_11655 [Chloroflexota bacterium]|nr:hypothetical protein [Chloroflexota bacterium]
MERGNNVRDLAAVRRARAAKARRASPRDRPSYQEMLRTVGALLDQAGSNLALVDIYPARVRVMATGPFGEQVLSIRYLSDCIAVQRELRGRTPARDPADLNRLSPVLRAVGAELDRQAQPSYRLAVTKGAVVIQGSRGYRRTLALDVLASLLQGAIGSRNLSLVQAED